MTTGKYQQGLFITFEGGDGSGKSTNFNILANALRHHGYDVLCLREPGGTSIGEMLRDILLNPANSEMVDECELLIYEAARAQLVRQIINPAIKAGKIVLCDRFYDSTLAYQSYGRGLDKKAIEGATDFACGGRRPDRTILMVAPGRGEALSRATKDGADRIESAGLDFHEKVNAGYLELAKEEPERIRVVVSDEPEVPTARKVFAELSDLFEWMADVQDAEFEELVAEYKATEK